MLLEKVRKNEQQKQSNQQKAQQNQQQNEQQKSQQKQQKHEQQKQHDENILRKVVQRHKLLLEHVERLEQHERIPGLEQQNNNQVQALQLELVHARKGKRLQRREQIDPKFAAENVGRQLQKSDNKRGVQQSRKPELQHSNPDDKSGAVEQANCQQKSEQRRVQFRQV